MRSCVVYESIYGNTHQVATAIADSLEEIGEVTIGSTADVAPEDVHGFDLLVVGGPTHVHGMSRTSTRAAAVETAEKDDAIVLDEDAPGPGLREWLERLPSVDNVRSAAFDTRVDKPVLLVGSAAKGIARHLKRHHFGALVEPESFFVDGSTGPLQSGEIERARQWGRSIASAWERVSR